MILTMPLQARPTDKASVHIEEAGHYRLSFIENADEQAELLPVVFDTQGV
jgi:hypothetical protein